MGRPKAEAPKKRIVSVRLDPADEVLFDALLARRRGELGLGADVYGERHLVRELIRDRATQLGLAEAKQPEPKRPSKKK